MESLGALATQLKLSRTGIDTVKEVMEKGQSLVLVGSVKAGKSTLFNALVGCRLSPVDADPCTAIALRAIDDPTCVGGPELRPGDGANGQVPLCPPCRAPRPS